MIMLISKKAFIAKKNLFCLSLNYKKVGIRVK